MPGVTSSEVDKKLLIEGLGKGLRVIESFTDEHSRLTATEAGQRAGLTRTAARRYLVSLVHFGYADTDGKHYWLSPRVLRLSEGFFASARIPRLVQPFLQRLSMQIGETANLSVLDGHEVVYLVRSNSPQVLSIGFHAGARLPAHVVSPGYAILSTFDQAGLDAWIATHTFERFTPQTITDVRQFRDCVAVARQSGYSSTDQFINRGLCGLAVALLDRRGHCVGALSVTLQVQAYPKSSFLVKLLPELQDTAQALRGIL
jgi:IclR family pca regulon transcriptional regulator